MKCEALFKKIDELNDKYVKVWEDVCNIESPTEYKEGVDACGKYLVELAKKRNWKIEVMPHENAGDSVCITMNPDVDAAPISLSGHLDTVHPVGLFGNPPVKIEGDIMRGPGTMDCKGGIVAGFLAMEALEELGYKERPVMMLLQTDEENGSSQSQKATINYICEKAKDSVAFMNLEGYTDGETCIARKGVLTYTFKITGVEAHAANCAKRGSNAILEAAHKIIELEKLKDHDGLTCNCGVIKGGSVQNTVPGYCEFKANIRFLNVEQLEWVKEYAKKIADTVYVEGCSCELVQSSFRICMEQNQRNVDLLEKMNCIWESNGLPRLVGKRHNGGSDAADVSAYGIPCIDCFGTSGGGIHSPNEFARISSLAESARRISSIIYCFDSNGV
jgi:glutamate carboxypeptidase